MTDVNLSWTYVTIDDLGGPSIVKETKHVVVLIDAGAGFGILGNPVVPPENTFLIEQLDPGMYTVRIEVIDISDTLTDTVDTPVEIIDGSLPGGVTSVQVVLS